MILVSTMVMTRIIVITMVLTTIFPVAESLEEMEVVELVEVEGVATSQPILMTMMSTVTILEPVMMVTFH